jgi:tRNA A64-2'-O-ribosylphosphate transferase
MEHSLTLKFAGMPDALSTTIPIWCTVLNLTLLPSNPLSSQLFLPPHLPATTHAQVSALIPSFVASLKALNLTLPSCLSKPLRPLWITQESSALTNDSDDGSIFDDYRPVICCTASRRVVGSEMDEGGYIQGAGDDTENWAHGLTAPVFWEHAQELLDTPEAELPDLIAELMEQSKLRGMDEAGNMHKQLNPYISVCPLPIKAEPSGTTQCCIELASQTIPRDAWIKSAHHMVAGLGKNKLASRNLRLALDDICNFAAAHVHSTAPREDNIDTLVIACDTGKDLAVGVALAISCYLFNDDNTLRSPEDKPSFTKDLIKKRLGGIMAIYPEANPSRSTLQSVNSFLMDWKK